MAEKRGRPEKVEVAGTEDLVQENDYLILYNGPDAMTAVKATSGASVQTGRGEFALGELAGFPYGRRFFASKVQFFCPCFPSQPFFVPKGLTGFVYPLRASPELLTAGGLAHRTQLVHSSDVSYITFALELRAGHRVVEAGTGSGSLTNALARITGDSGHVFTFEFHEERANFAKEAFAAIGNSSRITVTHRDVCEQGFLLEQDGRLLPGGADAVFLDVPCPWLAIGHVMTVLRPGGSLACYSPCLEQVAKTCEAMRVSWFLDCPSPFFV
jgi:tRNA (adenine57-N1/adenine58-N1)-methyltransferase